MKFITNAMNSREKQPFIAGIGVFDSRRREVGDNRRGPRRTSVTLGGIKTEERRREEGEAPRIVVYAGRGVALHRGPARRGVAPIRGGSLPRGGPRDG